VKRASGSDSRCQAMVRMELPTATRARTRLYWLGYLAVTMLSMMGADLGNRYA
jgi:hypothetical protein